MRPSVDTNKKTLAEVLGSQVEKGVSDQKAANSGTEAYDALDLVSSKRLFPSGPAIRWRKQRPPTYAVCRRIWVQSTFTNVSAFGFLSASKSHSHTAPCISTAVSFPAPLNSAAGSFPAPPFPAAGSMPASSSAAPSISETRDQESEPKLQQHRGG